MGRLALIFTGLLLVSCASGDEETMGDDIDTFPDASHTIIDASPRIDAPTQVFPDGGLEGLFCMSHEACSVTPGTCCVGLIPGLSDSGFCLPGELVVGAICNPL